jgi:hypothetical protein
MPVIWLSRKNEPDRTPRRLAVREHLRAGREDICTGCQRTVDEITRWGRMDNAERRGAGVVP